MKKIIYTLLVAVLALSFMGCPTVYEDLKPQVDLSSYYLRGYMNNWCNDAISDGALTANDDGTYSITYTADANSEFAIANEGWTSKFCNGTEVVVDGDFVELAAGGANAKVKGQVPGNNYKMTIKPLSNTVEVKVELAGVNVPSLYVIDSAKGPIKMDYDGTQYKYKAKATSTIIELSVWAENKGKYLEGTFAFGATTASDLTIVDELSTIEITGVESGKEYFVCVTYDGKKATVNAIEAKILGLAFFAINGPMGIKPLTATNNYTVEFNGVNKGWLDPAKCEEGDMAFTIYAHAIEADINKDEWWNGTVYRFGGFDITLGEKTKCESNGDNAVIKGITDGKKYKAVFESTSTDVYVTITEVTE